jgi:hypothetical protein
MVKMRVFVADETAERIRQCAEAWDTSASLVMRVAIEDLLGHQERLAGLLTPILGTTEDTRTPEQQAAGEAYLAAMAQVDLEQVAAELAIRSTPPGEE